MKTVFALLVMVPFVAHAQTAPADPAKAGAEIVLQKAQAAVKDAQAQPQQSVTQPAPTPVQAVPTPISVVAVASTPTIADQVKDDLVSLASILIPAMIGVGLTWMRSHLTIMQTAAMNDAVTKSANGFGALLVQAMQQRGGSIAALNAHSPEVSSLANSLIGNFPQFTSKLGMSAEKAGSVILKEAAKISVGSASPLVHVASVSPVKAASDALVSEAPKWHATAVS